LAQEIETETGLKFTIIATGGLAAILTTLEKTFDEIDRNLTLEGLRLITEANS
jgi:type III pantothenate kinase